MRDQPELEPLWARIDEALRLALLQGLGQVTLELRDAETLVVLAERAPAE